MFCKENIDENLKGMKSTNKSRKDMQEILRKQSPFVDSDNIGDDESLN